MELNPGDVVTLLPKHMDFYYKSENLRSIFVSYNGEVSKDYYTVIKILDSLKNKPVKAHILYMTSDVAFVKWISTVGTYTEYVKFENMKKTSVINKPFISEGNL
jgi:hypothetical protein